ncbi:GNAT family N-acetyltransferase [Tsuneonella sp. YG55]|uniref:GNAT family N-acetyltransferase n=1 Tax=Tsuneonella litorea TaxID=2976475 RepID=A0A9X2W0S0_9SPHN|nr:GNAT family N-acetyltransferase [Tsuneonella litorea]MCT2558773.1 GNAT family N-acetyltransferase [Tsuneonella litorea]
MPRLSRFFLAWVALRLCAVHQAWVNSERAIPFLKSLRRDPGLPEWPAGVRIVVFDEDRHPAPCHRLLRRAYSEGQGAVPDFDDWWQRLRNDAEYAADYTFVVLGDADQPVALAQCWSSAFLKDFAVASDWRRRGLGTALMMHVFDAFRRNGFEALRLKVRAGNLPAIAFYESLGMIREP